MTHHDIALSFYCATLMQYTVFVDFYIWPLRAILSHWKENAPKLEVHIYLQACRPSQVFEFKCLSVVILAWYCHVLSCFSCQSQQVDKLPRFCNTAIESAGADKDIRTLKQIQDKAQQVGCRRVKTC